MAVFCDHGSVRENWKLISEDNVEEGSSIIIFDNTVWQSVSSMPSSKRIQRTPAVRYCSSAKMANHHDVIIAPFELGVDDLASWVNLFDAAALSQRLHSLSLDDALLKYCNIEMLFFLLCCISRYLPCFMSRPKMRSSAGSPLHMHCQLCWGSQLQVLPPVCGDFDKIDNLYTFLEMTMDTILEMTMDTLVLLPSFMSFSNKQSTIHFRLETLLSPFWPLVILPSWNSYENIHTIILHSHGLSISEQHHFGGGNTWCQFCLLLFIRRKEPYDGSMTSAAKRILSRFLELKRCCGSCHCFPRRT